MNYSQCLRNESNKMLYFIFQPQAVAWRPSTLTHIHLRALSPCSSHASTSPPLPRPAQRTNTIKNGCQGPKRPPSSALFSRWRASSSSLSRAALTRESRNGTLTVHLVGSAGAGVALLRFEGSIRKHATAASRSSFFFARLPLIHSQATPAMNKLPPEIDKTVRSLQFEIVTSSAVWPALDVFTDALESASKAFNAVDNDPGATILADADTVTLLTVAIPAYARGLSQRREPLPAGVYMKVLDILECMRTSPPRHYTNQPNQLISLSLCCARFNTATTRLSLRPFHCFSASRAFSMTALFRSLRSTKMYEPIPLTTSEQLIHHTQAQLVNSFTENIKRGVLTSSFISEMCTRFQTQKPFPVSFETMNDAIFITYASNDEGKREGARNHLFMLCNAILSTIESFTEKEFRIFAFSVSSHLGAFDVQSAHLYNLS